jgi:hypothetical protein
LIGPSIVIFGTLGMPPIEAFLRILVSKYKEMCSPRFQFIYVGVEFWANHIYKMEVPWGTHWE